MLHFFSPALVQLLQVAGWTLLHSLWQGAVIWLVLQCILKVFPGAQPASKHGFALISLFLFASWVANTALVQWQQYQVILVSVHSGDLRQSLQMMPNVHSNAGVLLSTLPWLQVAMPWLMLCYCGGLVIMMARLSSGIAHLYQLRRRDIYPAGEPLESLLQSLQYRVGIAQRVTLRLSTRVVVPMVCGLLRPLILLPVTISEDLGPDGLEAILLHELAHIGRQDFIINMLQMFLETIFFFNPFVWWISATIRREREHCCDDFVVAHTQEPLIYARALTTLAQTQCRRETAFSLAAVGRKEHLFNRIKRIIEMKNQPLRYGRMIAVCSLAAIIIAVSIVYFSPSAAQHQKRSNTRVPSSGTGGSYTNVIVTDSNGVTHQYSSVHAMPAEECAALSRQLRAVQDTLKNLGNIIAPMAVTMGKTAAAMGAEAATTAQEALASVDWDAVSGNVNKALDQVDWNLVDQEIEKGLQDAQNSINSGQIRKNVQRGLAQARRAVAISMRNGRIAANMTALRADVGEGRDEVAQDHAENEAGRDKTLEEARKMRAEAQKDMEQARKEMQEAKEEMARVRDEMRRERQKQKSQE